MDYYRSKWQLFSSASQAIIDNADFRTPKERDKAVSILMRCLLSGIDCYMNEDPDVIALAQCLTGELDEEEGFPGFNNNFDMTNDQLRSLFPG